MTYKVILISVCCFAGIIALCLLNVLVVEPLAIPNDCYYHNREAPFLIRLFYDFPSSEGGHPIPNTNNIVVTIIIGILIGLYLAWRKLRGECT